MFSSVRKSHPILKVVNGSLIDLPAPVNLSYWWNFGSLLGLCLVLQIFTGIFLSIYYIGHVDLAFSSVSHIIRDVNYGWILRSFHANGASLFFVCLYLHIGRGIYYGSYMSVSTWNVGVLIFLLVIITAFIGYVLPWGQISFWGATVITNLVSAVPYIGSSIVHWIWGGFSIGAATLTRFFAFHFLFPFLVLGFSVVHLVFLHEVGSNNPLGLNCDVSRVPFHCYYSVKDVFGYFFVFFIFFLFVLCSPNFLIDPENYIPSNPLSTPPHIQPEWYFLFAYAILRAIPNKLGGVLALLFSVLILFSFSFLHISLCRSSSFSIFSQFFFWVFVSVFIILTWLGSCSVDFPYNVLGIFFTFFYFFFVIIFFFCGYVWRLLVFDFWLSIVGWFCFESRGEAFDSLFSFIENR